MAPEHDNQATGRHLHEDNRTIVVWVTAVQFDKWAWAKFDNPRRFSAIKDTIWLTNSRKTT